MEPLARVLAGAIDGPLGGLGKRLDAAAAEFAENEALADMVFGPAVKAEFAGQLMVREREAPKMKQPVGSFLNLPWPEAVQAFLDMGHIRESEFEPIMRHYVDLSENARALMLENLRTRTEEAVVRALEDGRTLPDFAKDFDAITDALGISPAKPYYVETIFRTNLQTAYGAGRYRAITDPAIAEARPYVEYHTAGDARVRDEHAVLNGLVFDVKSEEWRRIAPPNGFNCRCSMVTLSKQERGKRDVATEVPEDYVPTPEFDGPPV